MAKLKEKLEKIDSLLETMVVTIDNLQKGKAKKDPEPDPDEKQIDEKLEKIEKLTARIEKLKTENDEYASQLSHLTTGGGEDLSLKDAFAKYKGGQ